VRSIHLAIPLVGSVALAVVAALTVPEPSGAARPRGAVRPGPHAAAAVPSPAVPSPAVRAAAPGYSPRKPVIAASFADPFVIKAGTTYYAYGTNDGGANLPVATAPDITGPWRRQPSDGLARLPSWATGGRTWAPEVVPPGPANGRYVLYFTAHHKRSGKQCIGAATAPAPAGPFAALDGDPLICPADLGGAIDPSSFVDQDGRRYLLYKTDARETAAIWLVGLSPDGLHPAGPPRRILSRGSDPVLVESPALVRRGGRYVLFYSAGWYFTRGYQTRYAEAASLNGPYAKAGEPLQSTGRYGDEVDGPGGASVVTDETGDHLVFHGVLTFHRGGGVLRGMYVAALGWDGSRPVLRGVPARFEAERARPSGCGAAAGRPRASGGNALVLFPLPGCRVDLDVAAPETGRYTLRIKYANRSGAGAVQEVTVNGRSPMPVSFRTTKGDDWGTVSLAAGLAAGRNTLGFRRLSGTQQLDYVEIN
jgi:Glycosyl hydrolases family 43/Carbohydrate binding module (family 35)